MPKMVRVQLSMSYLVPADNEEVINSAKDALYDDMMAAYKNDTLGSCLEVVPAPDATSDNVPEFLQLCESCGSIGNDMCDC